MLADGDAAAVRGAAPRHCRCRKISFSETSTRPTALALGTPVRPPARRLRERTQSGAPPRGHLSPLRKERLRLATVRERYRPHTRSGAVFVQGRVREQPHRAPYVQPQGAPRHKTTSVNSPTVVTWLAGRRVTASAIENGASGRSLWHANAALRAAVTSAEGVTPFRPAHSTTADHNSATPSARAPPSAAANGSSASLRAGHDSVGGGGKSTGWALIAAGLRFTTSIT